MKGRLLDTVPLSSLTGVGAALSNKLAKINLHTVQDLLLHLPLRYEDRTHLYPIGELLPGVYATVEGEVLNCNISSAAFTIRINVTVVEMDILR